MTNKRMQSIAAAIQPAAPRLLVRPPLMIDPACAHSIKGLAFESHSRNAHTFYVWAFVAPLFVPRTHITLDIGRRIGKVPWDETSMSCLSDLRDAIESEAMPFLDRITSIADVVLAAKDLHAATNAQMQQVVAFGMIRAGDFTDGLNELRLLRNMLDHSVPWQAAMVPRVERLIELVTKDPQAAVAALLLLESEGAARCGIDARQ